MPAGNQNQVNEALLENSLIAIVREIDTGGGYQVKKDKKAALLQFMKLLSSFSGPLVKQNKLIHNKLADELLKLTESNSSQKVFNFDVNKVTQDSIESLSEEDLVKFKKILLAKYKALVLSDDIDLENLQKVLKEEQHRLKKNVSGKQEDLAILKIRNELQQIENIEKKLKLLEEELSKLEDKPENQANITLLNGKIEKLSQELKPLINDSTVDYVKSEKIEGITALEEKKELDKTQNQETLLSLEDLHQKVNEVVRTRVQLISTEDSTQAIASADRFEAAIKDLKVFDKQQKEKLNNVNVKKSLTAAINAQSTIQLSRGTGEKRSNIVMIVSAMFSGWTFDKTYYEKEIATNTAGYIAPDSTTGFTKKSIDEEHVFVNLAPKNEEEDIASECVRAIKTCRNGQKIVLTQEVDGSRVKLWTELTEPTYTKEDINEAAIIQAKMLLDNYNPDDDIDCIKINHQDPVMAAKIHAALLLMRGDTPAKNLEIDNRNLSSEVPGKFLGIVQTSSFIKSQLGDNIFSQYETIWQKKIKKHSEIMRSVRKEKMHADGHYEVREGETPSIKRK